MQAAIKDKKKAILNSMSKKVKFQDAIMVKSDLAIQCPTPGLMSSWKREIITAETAIIIFSEIQNQVWRRNASAGLTIKVINIILIGNKLRYK